MGRSWSVPFYILSGHVPDAFPADEDLIPIDGEPHPEHPHEFLDLILKPQIGSMNIMERQPTWVLLGEINSTVTR
jgi:hypothetical protein